MSDTTTEISNQKNMPDTSVIRISHCRYRDGARVRRNEVFDKVVTVVWTYDQEDEALHYGAAVYNSESTDNWNKAVYRHLAMDRYYGSPVKVLIDWKEFRERDDEMIGPVLDRCISSRFVNEYGTGERKASQETNEYYYGYNRGKKRGYQVGYSRGYVRGYNKVFDTRYNDGYTTGILHSFQFALTTLVGAATVIAYYAV